MGYTKKGKREFGFKKGSSKVEIEKILKDENIFVEKIISLSFFSKKEKAENIIMLFSESKMFVKNGYSFQKILDILEENKNLKVYTDKMKESLKKGESLYEMFKNSGINLKSSEYMLIKSGEESGNIYRAFENIENGIRDREKTRKEILKIMVYPITVLCMSILIVIFTGAYILPDFVKIIEATSSKLPFITKAIIWFANNFIFFILFLTILFLSLIYFFKNKKIKENLFQILMKVSIFKYIRNKIFISNFTYVLAILLSSGITITEAVKIIKSETDNKYFESKIEESEEFLRKGKSVGKSLEKMAVFSKIDLELISSGEEAGELENTLLLVSLRNKEYLKEKLRLGIKVLEPLSIIVVGAITGVIFLGIYMPIFQMMDNINI